MTTAELPSGSGGRLTMPGQTPSIKIIAPPMVSAEWATVPSDPGRRFTSTAPNTALQKSISAAASRHTSIGITTDTPSGTGFTLDMMVCLTGRMGASLVHPVTGRTAPTCGAPPDVYSATGVRHRLTNLVTSLPADLSSKFLGRVDHGA